ncbi:hypothetical protein GGI22_006423, partial [Coemansia erecta]
MDNQSPQSLTKKRNTAKENDFHALSAEFDENAGMLDLRHASDLERRQTRWVERMAGVCNLWDRAVRDLDIIINGNAQLAADSSEESLETWLELVIPSKLSDIPSSQDDEQYKEVASTRTSLEKFNQSMQRILQKLQERDNDRVLQAID